LREDFFLGFLFFLVYQGNGQVAWVGFITFVTFVITVKKIEQSEQVQNDRGRFELVRS
jgi:hypothetical protein